MHCGSLIRRCFWGPHVPLYTGGTYSMALLKSFLELQKRDIGYFDVWRSLGILCAVLETDIRDLQWFTWWSEPMKPNSKFLCWTFSTTIVSGIQTPSLQIWNLSTLAWHYPHTALPHTCVYYIWLKSRQSNNKLCFVACKTLRQIRKRTTRCWVEISERVP